MRHCTGDKRRHKDDTVFVIVAVKVVAEADPDEYAALLRAAGTPEGRPAAPAAKAKAVAKQHEPDTDDAKTQPPSRCPSTTRPSWARRSRYCCARC